MVGMTSTKVSLSPLMFCLLFGMCFASGAYAQSVSVSVVNNSLCFVSDTDNDQSTPVAYSLANAACVEPSAINDLNAFRVTSTTSGNGTSAAVFDLNAGVAVDANSFSSEYQAGRIAYAYTVSITGTGGAPWDLTVDQQMQGLLATDSDGTGSANASSSGVSAVLNLGSVSFGALTTRNSFSFGSTPFSASRTGDLIQGVGDTVLSGTVEITLDAFSEWGGFFGSALDGAVLFGIDDVSQSIFVSIDEYATWARAVGPDGYQASFSLALTGGFCGDGTTDPGEECDDAGTVNGDGCSSNCLIEFCGDGITQAGLGEQCDDGGNVAGDGCSATCTSEGAGVPALSSTGLAILILSLLGLALFATLVPRRLSALSVSRDGSQRKR
jgi:cysteine-rich repeat protein